MSTLHNRVIRQTDSLRNALFRLLDAAAVVVGLMIAVSVEPTADSKATLVTCLAAIGIYSVTAEFTAMYRNWHAVSLRREIGCASITWALTLLLLSAIGRFSEYTSELSSAVLWIWFGATPSIAILGRIVMRKSRRWMIEHDV